MYTLHLPHSSRIAFLLLPLKKTMQLVQDVEPVANICVTASP